MGRVLQFKSFTALNVEWDRPVRRGGTVFALGLPFSERDEGDLFFEDHIDSLRTEVDCFRVDLRIAASRLSLCVTRSAKFVLAFL